MTEAEQVHIRAHERYKRIMEDEDPAVLAKILGRRLTIGPMVARAIVSDMNQNFEIPEGKTAVDVIVSHMLTILLAPVQLEVRSVEGHNVSELHVFPFGFEHQELSFPFQVLRYDWVAMACIQRFHLQGRCNNLGGLIFHRDHITTDRTRATYSRFAYNAIMGNAMFRTAFLATYMTVYAAQAFEKQNCQNPDERNDTAIEHTRVLMQDCLERAAQRLAKLAEQPRKPSKLLRRHVHELIDVCNDRELFTSAVLIEKAAAFAYEQVRDAKSV